MRRLLIAALILATALPLLCQAPAAKWTVGTVMAVKPHEAKASEDPASGSRYDMTVQVGKTRYVVLYTQPAGTADLEYAVGRDAPVIVGEKTLTVRDKLGRTAALPILSRTPAAKQNVR